MSHQYDVIFKRKDWVAYAWGDYVQVIHDGYAYAFRSAEDVAKARMQADLFNTLQGWFRYGKRPTKTNRV